MPRLIEVRSGHSIDLPAQRSTFGTAADNTVPIAEGFQISARHFQISPVPGGNLLLDMTGQQATLVNDQPVSQVMLKNGDMITAGQLLLRYECPPPLPSANPAAPPCANDAGPASALPAPAGYGTPSPQNFVTPRRNGKVEGRDYTVSGKSSMPNAATAVHLYKWMLPALGIILFVVRWIYNIYSVKSDMDKGDAVGTAYMLVDIYREAQEAGSPQIENISDPDRLVRLLVRGVYGGGDQADHEFKAPIDIAEAEDAIEILTWTEGTGLTLKHEYRDVSEELDDL